MKIKLKIRISLHLIFYLLAAICLLFLFLYFYPLSLKSINKRIEKTFSTSLGENVIIKKARLYFYQGRCVIYDLYVNPDFNIRKVEIYFSPWELIKEQNLNIKTIFIKDPAKIKLNYTNGKIDIDPSQKFIFNIKKSEKVESNQVNIEPLIKIYDAAIELKSDDIFIKDTCFQFTNIDADIDLSSEISRSLRLNIKGIFNNAGNAKLKGFVFIEKQNKEVSYSFAIDKFFQKKLQPFNVSKDISLHDIYIKGNAKIANNLIKAECNLQIDKAEYEQTNPDLILIDEDLTVSSTLTFAKKTNWELNTNLNSKKINCAAKLQRTEKYSKPRFLINLSTKEFLKEFYEIFKNGNQQKDFDIDISNAKYRISASLSGILDDENDFLKNNYFNAGIYFQDFKIYHKILKGWIEEINGEVYLNNKDIIVDNIKGNFKNINLSLWGKIAGDKYFYKPANANINWSTKFKFDDLLRQIRKQTNVTLSENFIEGEIEGNGTVSEILINKINKDKIYNNITAVGNFKISNGKINHSFLPSQIHNVNGNLIISNNNIDIEYLNGKMGKSSVNLSGTIKGTDFFWIEPLLDLNIFSDFNVDDITRFVTNQKIKDQLRKIFLSGLTKSIIKIDGKLLSPEEWSVKGTSQIKDAAIDLNEYFLNGKIENLSGSINIFEDYLSFEYFKAKINNIPINLSGKLYEKSLQINTFIEANLGDVKNAFPDIFEEFIMQGNAKAKAQLIISEKNISEDKIDDLQKNSDKSTYRKFFKWHKIANSNGNGNNIPFDIKMEAELEPLGATFTHRDMPQLITDIRGKFFFKDEKISFKNVISNWGKSKNCSVSGSVDFTKDIPTINFNLKTKEAYLHEWTDGWKSQGGKVILDKETNVTTPTKEIFGIINADIVHFGELDGTNFSGEFTYSHYSDEPNYFHFYDCSTEAYDGKIFGQGMIRVPSGDSIYEATMECSKVNIEKFLKKIRPDKEPISGILDTLIHFNGKGTSLNSLVGEGNFNISQSRFVGNVIFKTIGTILNLPLIHNVTFTSINSNYDIKDGKIFFPNLNFFSTGIEMKAVGEIYFNKNINMEVYLGILNTLLKDIPLINRVLGWVHDLTKSIIKFHIKGNIDKPEISVVPLSIDKIKNIFK